jgi:hypothetical protein
MGLSQFPAPGVGELFVFTGFKFDPVFRPFASFKDEGTTDVRFEEDLW